MELKAFAGAENFKHQARKVSWTFYILNFLLETSFIVKLLVCSLIFALVWEKKLLGAAKLEFLTSKHKAWCSKRGSGSAGTLRSELKLIFLDKMKVFVIFSLHFLAQYREESCSCKL